MIRTTAFKDPVTKLLSSQFRQPPTHAKIAASPTATTSSSDSPTSAQACVKCAGESRPASSVTCCTPLRQDRRDARNVSDSADDVDEQRNLRVRWCYSMELLSLGAGAKEFA